MNKLISTLYLVGKINKNSTNIRKLCTLVPQEIKKKTELITLNSVEEIDWEKELNIMRKEDRDSILAPCQEDLSTIGPYIKPTFNFAAYINKSETLQKLVQLGVDLHKVERKKNSTEFILKLDFEKDMKDHIFFLHNKGVTSEKLGWYLTKNPYIFRENLQDLEIRINYLEAKKFDKAMIQNIITKNPYWLMFSTQRIDARLGEFQTSFKLTGEEVRALATKEPRLITYNRNHIKLNTFSVKEEMGFSDQQMKKLLLKLPKLWMYNQDSINKRFTYINNVMNISHEKILEEPKILSCREKRIEERHTFLEKLGRAQYDSMKPNFVSLEKLIEGTDSEFCYNVAKSNVEVFNNFLKTL